VVIIFIIAACGGTKKVNIDIHVPEVDRTSYNDSSFEEGWKSLRAGNPKLAMKYFQQSQTADEKLFAGFGYVFLSQNKISLAKKNFENSLAINPDNMQAEFGMATLYELVKDIDRAFQVYSKCRVKYPENAWIKVRYDYLKSTETQKFLEQAKQFKQQEKKEEYIKALEKAAQYSPEIIDIEIEIADFYHEDEKYDQAIFHYEKILEKLPNKETILLKLAEVYEKTNNLDSAVIIYKRMLEFKPGDSSILQKINDLKIKFYELKLPEKFKNPQKFKNIFFKKNVNREELAALIGYYFEDYFNYSSPVIITDITGSFAKNYIIMVCTLNIMKKRPDHSFNRFHIITRADFSVVINALLKYLQDVAGYLITFTPLEEIFEPVDISPLHKNYKIIKFMINSQLIKLDDQNNFNPLTEVTPSEVLVAIKKILNSMEERED
jgi:tetratricopeptide (TPR) repeat protein